MDRRKFADSPLAKPSLGTVYPTKTENKTREFSLGLIVGRIESIGNQRIGWI